MSIEYFLDEMKLYEIDTYLDFIDYTDKNILLTNRFIALSVAQQFCKKRLKAKDIYELPWDHNTIEMDEEYHKKAQIISNKLEDFINKKN